MSIRKGSEYGARGPVPIDSPVANSDSEIRSIIIESRRSGIEAQIIRLTGGDLHRTLGGVTSSVETEDALIVPIDLCEFVTDEVDSVFVAHLIAGPMFGRNFVAAMNAQWVGQLDLGPRSHPADGLVDITSGSLGLRERRAARRRARSGTHLPHPSLKVERVRTWERTFDRPTTISVDGSSIGATRSLSIRVIPDAFFVAI